MILITVINMRQVIEIRDYCNNASSNKRKINYKTKEMGFYPPL